MRRQNLDLMLAIAIALVNMLWLLLPNSLPMARTVLAVPFVLVLPGYTLTEVLSYKRSLETSHHVVFSIGLSLTLVILAGFVLNLLQVGLKAASWSVLLGLLTIIFSLLAGYLRRYRSADRSERLRFRLTIFQVLLLLFAIVLIPLSYLYDAVSAAQQPHAGFTQLWMLPSEKSCAVRFGIHSFETSPVTYLASMSVNGKSTSTWSSIVLSPQEEWDQSESILPQPTTTATVELQLYRLDKPHILYRTVTVTFPRGQCSAT